MKRITLILFLGLSTLQLNAQLNKCRELFFSEMSESNCELIIAKAKPKSSENPVLKAYEGACTASLAEFGYNPAKKLSLFNEGKNLINEAVLKDPNNPEIRLLRLTIQLEAPGFLNYNSNIDEDKKLVLEWIQGQEEPDSVFLHDIKKYLTSKKILE